MGSALFNEQIIIAQKNLYKLLTLKNRSNKFDF